MKLFKKKSKSNSSGGIPKEFACDQGVKIQAGLAQSVGKTRDHMEDAAFSLVLHAGARGKTTMAGLFIVADGMGGHSNGEVASAVAIQNFVETVDLPSLARQENLEQSEINALLETALNNAQEAVLGQVSGGGSTLTAALVLDRKVSFAHVGDSRLYLLSAEDEFRVLTRDHSLVQRLVDLGQITAAEAELHPQKNVLYRALGQTDGFKVDLGEYELEHPVRLLLCSDGLWGLVSEKLLCGGVALPLPVEERARALCELANDAGGTDNISAIVVDIF